MCFETTFEGEGIGEKSDVKGKILPKFRILLLSSSKLSLSLLLLQYLLSAQIQASLSQRRWCSDVGNMASR